MSFTIDFGFEEAGAPWDRAKMAILFVSRTEPTDLGRLPGPTAIADAARYVEMFELQSGITPGEVGTYAEVINQPDPLPAVAEQVVSAKNGGKLAVVVADDRRCTEHCCTENLVALWGKLGRAEADEGQLMENRSSVFAGVRAATSTAFKTIPGSVTIITARRLNQEQQTLQTALQRMDQPVYLSIDVDVLSPGVAQTPRSLEPGGLSWYALVDAMTTVAHGPGIAAVELVGTQRINPRSPCAALCAQLLVKLAGVHYFAKTLR